MIEPDDLAHSVLRAPDASCRLEEMETLLTTERTSLLLLLPHLWSETILLRALTERLTHGQQDWRHYEAGINSSGLPRPPAIQLSHSLGLEHISPSVARLVKDGNTPPLNFVTGVGIRPPEEQADWVDFMVRWADHARSVQEAGDLPPVLCLICSADMMPHLSPTEDLLLRVRHWHGVPSGHDWRTICRCMDRSASGAWREHLLPELVGGDCSLAAYLWDEFDDEPGALFTRLRDYGQNRGWTRAALEDLSIGCLARLPPLLAGASEGERAFSVSEEVLWRDGLVYASPERGVEIHSAALAILERYDIICHRLWRAQATLLLPLIDAVRLSLCDYIAERHGQAWPYHLLASDDPDYETVCSQPTAAEPGLLKTLLCQRLRQYVPDHVRDLAQTIWEDRNTLAHYKLLSYKNYQDLLRKMRFTRAALAIPG